MNCWRARQHAPPSGATRSNWLFTATLIALAILVGVGGFTFGYAKGFSYLSSDVGGENAGGAVAHCPALPLQSEQPFIALEHQLSVEFLRYATIPPTIISPRLGQVTIETS